MEVSEQMKQIKQYISMQTKIENETRQKLNMQHENQIVQYIPTNEYYLPDTLDQYFQYLSLGIMMPQGLKFKQEQ